MAQAAVAEIPRLLAELRDLIERKTKKPIDPDVDFLTTQIEVLSAAQPLTLNFEWLGLTPTERRMLSLLASRPGMAFNRDAIMAAMYFDRTTDEEEPERKIVDVYAVKLRNKLYAHDADCWIETVWGTGYRYVNKRARAEWDKTANGQPRKTGRKFGHAA